MHRDFPKGMRYSNYNEKEKNTDPLRNKVSDTISKFNPSQYDGLEFITCK